MKTKVIYLATKLTVAVILVALLAVKALAGEAPKLKLVPHSTEKAIIVVDNPSDAITELSIEDIDGNVLYYREGSIDSKIYSKMFDFKNLRDGDYKVVVTNKYGEKEVYFKVDDKEIFVVKDVAEIEPFFQVDGDVLKLSYLNHNQGRISLTIANSDGEFFSKSLGDDFSITAGFSLSKLTSGEYSASLSDGKNTFNYTFEK